MRTYRKIGGKRLKYRKSKQVKGKRRQIKKTGRRRRISRTRRRKSRVKRGGKWAAFNILSDVENSTLNTSKMMDMYNGVKNSEGGTTYSSYGRE
tara:strand:- start:1278 stop:1559 length:282 start_codon:yes stop_codon:yes gene_type:complete